MKLKCIFYLQVNHPIISIDIFVNCYFFSPFSTQSVHFNHVGCTDIKAIQCASVWRVVIWRVRKLCSLLFYNDRINEFVFYSVFFVNYSGILTCFFRCFYSCLLEVFGFFSSFKLMELRSTCQYYHSEELFIEFCFKYDILQWIIFSSDGFSKLIFKYFQVIYLIMYKNCLYTSIYDILYFIKRKLCYRQKCLYLFFAYGQYNCCIIIFF